MSTYFKCSEDILVFRREVEMRSPELRTFKNDTLHVSSVCRDGGQRAQSPCPRNHVLSLEKWRELLVEAGEEVVPL